jgi:hypothetical protein
VGIIYAQNLDRLSACFHLIGFPSEWGSTPLDPIPEQISRPICEPPQESRTITNIFCPPQRLKPLPSKAARSATSLRGLRHFAAGLATGTFQ